MAWAQGLCLAVAAALAAGLARAEAAGPRVGDRAPEFALPASTSGVVRLADFAGKRHVILAFYIQDFTPG
jgi:peroxiredoxin Q/BCP